MAYIAPQVTGRGRVGGVAMPPQAYQNLLKSRKGRMLGTGEEAYSPYFMSQFLQTSMEDTAKEQMGNRQGSFLQKLSQLQQTQKSKEEQVAEVQRTRIAQTQESKAKFESMRAEAYSRSMDAYNRMRSEIDAKKKEFAEAQQKALQSQKWYQGVMEKSGFETKPGEMGGGLGWTAGNVGASMLASQIGGVAFPYTGAFGLAVMALERGVERPAQKRKMQQRQAYVKYLQANPDIWEKAVTDWESKGVAKLGWSEDNTLLGIIPRKKAIESGYVKDEPRNPLQPQPYGVSVGFDVTGGYRTALDQPEIPEYLAKQYPTGGGGDIGVEQPYWSWEEGAWKDPTNPSLVLEEPQPIRQGEVALSRDTLRNILAGQRWNEENI